MHFPLSIYSSCAIPRLHRGCRVRMQTTAQPEAVANARLQPGAAPLATSAALAITPGSLRDLLLDFYRQYDPPRLEYVDDIIAQHGEDDEELCSFLEARYGAHGYFSRHEYNLCSRFFNPLKALYDGHVIPPVPTVRPLDNIHKAQVFLPRASAVGAAGQAQQAQQAQPQQQAPALVRFGVLHTDEVAAHDARYRAGILPPTMLDHIAASAAFTTGPRALLKRLYDGKCRVTVETRGSTGSSGAGSAGGAGGAGAGSGGGGRGPSYARVTGVLAGFDEHYNLLLQDAVEEAGLGTTDSTATAASGASGSGSGGGVAAAAAAGRQLHTGYTVLRGDTVLTVRQAMQAGR